MRCISTVFLCVFFIALDLYIELNDCRRIRHTWQSIALSTITNVSTIYPHLIPNEVLFEAVGIQTVCKRAWQIFICTCMVNGSLTS